MMTSPGLPTPSAPTPPDLTPPAPTPSELAPPDLTPSELAPPDLTPSAPTPPDLTPSAPTPPDLTPPQAKGPYSTTRRVGDVLYLSGQSATDPVTGEAVLAGIPAQTELTLRNMHALLESEGFTLADLVQVTCYLTDMDDWPQMNTAYAAYFGDGPLPTRTAVGVASLPFGLHVEMTGVAHRSEVP